MKYVFFISIFKFQVSNLKTLHQLKSDIQFLKGVGPKRAELLNNELSIFTYEDILQHYPFRYIDRTKFYKLNEINESLPNIQSKGIISNFKEKGGGKKKYLVAEFSDETGSIELIKCSYIIQTADMIFVFMSKKYGIQLSNFFSEYLLPEIRACINHNIFSVNTNQNRTS